MTSASAAPGPSGRNATGPDPVLPPIRLMIVDDSAVARAVLSRMLSAHKDLEVVALAGNAAEALEALRNIKVDVVLLDVEMPGTTGLDALPDLLRRSDGARVLIVSSLCDDGAEAAVRALALGAADTLPKPGTGAFGGRFSEVLAERLRRMGRVDRGRGSTSKSEAARGRVNVRAMPDARLGCLAMGASTGGLHGLSEFLRALPPRIGAPILVTQHLPTTFMPFFARQIQAASGRPTRVAEEGLQLRSEEILLAPGDAHLGLVRDGARVMVKLASGRAESGCMPSVDTMFAAVAEVYGKTGIGLVFSGMGRDGLAGSARIVERGGAVLAQDRRTSAVWGMPGAIAEAGLACAVLPPAQLARAIAARVSAWS